MTPTQLATVGMEPHGRTAEPDNDRPIGVTIARPYLVPVIESQSVGFLYTKLGFLAPGPTPPPPAPKSADPRVRRAGRWSKQGGRKLRKQ